MRNTSSGKSLDKNQLVILLVVLLAIATALVFVLRTEITGFQVAGQTQTFAQSLNIVATENQEQDLVLQTFPENSSLSSLSLSGSAIGDGKISVYLVSGNQKLLILDSDSVKKEPSSLTGFSAADTSDSQDSSSPSDGGDSAQPGPPSSSDSNAGGSDTEPSGPGAEQPTETPPEQPTQTPEETQPVEAPPQEEPSQPPAPPEENQTPEENITVPENITQPGNITEAPVAPKEYKFENLCLETCYLPDGFTDSSYTLQIEVEAGTTLKLDSMVYTLLIPETPIVENVTNETVFFETTIKDADNNTVPATIDFVDSKTKDVEAIGKSEKGDPEIEEVEKSRSSNQAEPSSAGSSESSDSLGEEKSSAKPEPSSSNNTAGTGSDTGPSDSGAASPILQGAAVAEQLPANAAPIEEATGAPGLDLPKDKYDIAVKFQNYPIQQIEFKDLDVQKDVNNFIKVDDAPESGAFAEVYAIDPTGFNFTTATVTAIAKGTELYKCKDWDFANQACLGDWVALQSITPGQAYTFTLTPEDPGYAELRAQTCAAEDNAGTKSSFGGACDGTYPNATCGAGGDLLSCNDGSVETHTYQKNNYGGVKISQFNTSITNCQAITNVQLCYEWWRTSGASATDCDISVDNQNGTNFTAVTTTCPGTSANPGATCTNVTNLKTWTCANFFGASGNRSMVKSEITRVTSGAATTETASWDTLYFAVNYTIDTTPPQWSNPQKNATTIYKNDYVKFNTSWTDNAGLSAYIFSTNDTGSWVNQSAVTFSGTSNTSTQTYQVTASRNTVVGWRFYANDTTNNWNATSIQTFTVSDKAPTSVTLNGPADAYTETSSNTITFNCSATDDYALANITLYGNFSGSWASNGTNTVTGTSNTTTFSRTLANGGYIWNCLATDDAAQTAFATSNRTITVNVDTTPPVISAVSATSITTNSATITWTTDESSNSTVNYGTSLSLGSSASNSTAVTSHSVPLSSLSDATVYYYNVTSCDASGNCATSGPRNFTTTDGTAPKYSSLVTSPSSPATYSSGGNYQFNATWTDNYGVASVTLEFDGVNYTDLTQNGNVYSRTFGSLAAGTYNYTWYASDIAGNSANTGTQTYTVNIAPSEVNLTLNGTDDNITVNVGSQVNITGILATGQGTIELYSNGNLINNGTSPLSNLTAYDSLGTFNVTVNYLENQNYTASEETHWVTVVDTMGPVINSLSDSPDPVEKGSRVEIEANITDNVNVSAATVRIDDTNHTMFRGGTADDEMLDAMAAGTGNGWTACTDWNTCLDTATLTNYGDGSSADKVTASSNFKMLHNAVSKTGLPSSAKINYVAYNVVIATNTAASGQGFKFHTSDCDNFHFDLTGVKETNSTFQKFSQQFTTTSGGNNWTVACLDGVFEPGIRASGTTITGWEVDQFYITVNYNNNQSMDLFFYSQNTAGLSTGIHDYTVYANDTAGNAATPQSGTFNVTGNNPPTQGTPILNSTFGTNLTTENLTVYNQSTFDADGDPVVNVYDWRIEGESIAVLNMPFEATTTSTYSKDFSNYNHDGTASSITYSATGGKIGGAYSFNNADDEVEVPMIEGLDDPDENYNFETDTDFTLEAWVKSTDTAGTIISKGNSTSGPAYYISIAAGKAKAYVSDGTNTASVTSSASVNDNVYHHIAATFNRGQNLTLYVDGVNVATTVISSVGNVSNSKSLFIGSAGGTNWLSGRVDEVKVYPRALSVQQIGLHSQAIYDKIVAQETENGDVWTAVVTPSDGKDLGATKASNSLTIIQVESSTQLYIDGAQSNKTITYGTQSNATAVTDIGSVTLYRNGVAVSNPEITTLGTGTYNYTAVNPGDDTIVPSSETWFLTVNKVASDLNLLLNGVDGNISVNRSQSVNITGTRSAGEGSMELYDNGVLINSGTPPLTNTTSYTTLGARNITLVELETENYAASSETHFVTALGTLTATLTEPQAPAPIVYQGQNITFTASVIDDLGAPLTGATVTFEPINGSNVYLCSDTTDLGDGTYSCTLNTAGMVVPTYYDVRVNATKALHNSASSTTNSAFYLSYDQSATLIAEKSPSVQSVNNTNIVYNLTLELEASRGSSEDTVLQDTDGNINENVGTVTTAGQERTYLLAYTRGATDQTVTLSKANATGHDPLYDADLFAESNQPVIIVPQSVTDAQLTIVKNIVYLEQTTTNITYTITDEIVNSGGQDLNGISVTDSDIGLATFVDLDRGESATYSGNKTIAKSAQSYTYTFVQATASANSQFFYSNVPEVQIPGYGGPYDVIIDSLPASVTTGSSITGTVKAINMNTEVSEDRTLTTWIEYSNGTVLDLDVRVIFIGRNASATAQVTLTAPSTPGTYTFVSELTWPTASASASATFEATEAVTPPTGGGVGGGGVETPAATVPAVQVPTEIIQPQGEIPADIIADLIRLTNSVNDVDGQKLDENSQLLLADIKALIQQAEDAAARGRYDEARNDIRTAYGKLQILQEISPITAFQVKLPSINVQFNSKYVMTGLFMVFAAIFIMAFIQRRKEDMATEVQLLKQEREHLENLYKKVDDYLNRTRAERGSAGHSKTKGFDRERKNGV